MAKTTKRKAYSPVYGIPVETCMLVKPDPAGDPYVTLLAGLPDLIPPNGRYDTYKGEPSPKTVAATKHWAPRWFRNPKETP